MKLTTFPSREDWLSARRHGIGGSDVPAILGTSPYGTPLKVWADKRGLGEDIPDSYILRRGHHMEALLADELAAQANVLVHRHAEPHVIAEGAEPWMLYSPDAFGREADGTRVLCEFKSHPKGSSDWAEGAPPHVVDQVQWGMYVCGIARAYVAVDLGTDANWAKIDADPEWVATNVPRLRAFWTTVESGEPPAPFGDETSALKRIYPREQDGLTVSLSGDMLDLRWEYDRIAEQVREGEKRMNEIKSRVQAEMKDAERAVLPDGSFYTWTTVTKNGYEVKPTSYREFRAGKAKGGK